MTTERKQIIYDYVRFRILSKRTENSIKKVQSSENNIYHLY